MRVTRDASERRVVGPGLRRRGLTSGRAGIEELVG